MSNKDQGDIVARGKHAEEVLQSLKKKDSRVMLEAKLMHGDEKPLEIAFYSGTELEAAGARTRVSRADFCAAVESYFRGLAEIHMENMISDGKLDMDATVRTSCKRAMEKLDASGWVEKLLQEELRRLVGDRVAERYEVSAVVEIREKR